MIPYVCHIDGKAIRECLLDAKIPVCGVRDTKIGIHGKGVAWVGILRAARWGQTVAAPDCTGADGEDGPSGAPIEACTRKGKGGHRHVAIAWDCNCLPSRIEGRDLSSG